MRQLLPEPSDEVDLVHLYGARRPTVVGRPWVALDMVASLDGATARQGRSGQLGGPGDHRVFHTLRSLADVILVGAGTVRAERYGPVRLAPEIQEARVQRGQEALPRIAVVSRRLDLDLASPLFRSDESTALVITAPGAATARRVEVAAATDLLLAGSGDDVDLSVALVTLGELGARLVVCEGGPILNGQLIALDLVDEVCLTVAPLLVGGSSARVATGTEPLDLTRFELASVLEEHGELFVRAVRAPVP